MRAKRRSPVDMMGGLQGSSHPLKRAGSRSRSHPKQFMFRNGKNFGAAPGSLKDKVRPPDSSKIYQQEGDTFSISADALGTKVPTSFKAGGSVLLTVARRGEIAFAEVEPPLTGRAAQGPRQPPRPQRTPMA